MHSLRQGADPATYPQACVGFDYDAVDEVTLDIAEEVQRRIPALFKFIAFLVIAHDSMRLDVAIAAIVSALPGSSYTELAPIIRSASRRSISTCSNFRKTFSSLQRGAKSPQAR
jgi:hypothetical protein